MSRKQELAVLIEPASKRLEEPKNIWTNTGSMQCLNRASLKEAGRTSNVNRSSNHNKSSVLIEPASKRLEEQLMIP